MNLLHYCALTLGCLAISVGPAGAKASARFSGTPKILDGDTVQFDSIKLHMEGMDAPQIDQICLDSSGSHWKCGVAAREQLKSRAVGKPWMCKATRKDAYGRLLAVCHVDGEDIAREMIEEGWALASMTGSRRYLTDEKAARTSAAGLWAGAFVSPRDWRRHNRHAKILGIVKPRAQNSKRLLRSAFGARRPSRDCAIKGNVNWSGKCIFHKPGGHRYKRITMEARYGDRWFCTVNEAKASGCRATRR